MSKQASPPTFGQPEPGRNYETRQGAYAFFPNPDQSLWAVVKTPHGYFLPGGGLECGESAQVALARELLEEIGFNLISAIEFARANQFHWSEFYKKHFLKQGVFFRIDAAPSTPASGQSDLTLCWWPLERLAKDLSQEFQRYAAGILFEKPSGI